MNDEDCEKLLKDLFSNKQKNTIISIKPIKRKFEECNKKNDDDDDDDEEEEEEEEEDEDEEEDDDDDSDYDIFDDKKILNNFLKDIQDLSNKVKVKYKNEKINIILDKLIKKMNYKKNEEKEKKDEENFKKYNKLLNNDIKSQYNYFKDDLTDKEQKNIIDQIKKISNPNKNKIPYMIQLFKLNLSNDIKHVIMKKLISLENMNSYNGEYSKLSNWIKLFFQIPFNKYSYLEIKKEDGIKKCQAFIEKSKVILDTAVYGMNEAKIQFMQLIGQMIKNPSSIGNSIALKGPMGTGKTTLLKNGISKLLNREIGFITLGGANDGSYLEGHSYTYEGSIYGKIIDVLIQCKTMNPIIYFDELDKVSDSAKGEEIIGILTHLIDTTQNNEFQDKFFSEINIDMSKCLFIFSYNDENKVNKILRDRMFVIETKGYNTLDKIYISRQFIIPKIEEILLLKHDSIKFTDDVISYIIEHKTEKEEGVRNLKRIFEIIYNKINLFQMMKPNTNLFNEEVINNIKYPLEMTKDIIDKIINIKKSEKPYLSMYI